MSDSNKQKGFGLVELMVAMAIGLILMSIIFQIFVSNKESYQIITSITSRDEGARYAIDLINSEMKTLGYRGCVREEGDTTNNFNSNIYSYKYNEVIRGFEGTGRGFSPDLPFDSDSISKNSDVLVIRPTNPRGYNVINNMDLSTHSATLSGTSGLNVGDPVVISDCAIASIFKINSITGNTIGYESSTAIPKEFNRGSQVHKLYTVAYFIQASADDNNTLSLYRKLNNDSPQELIRGIENLQVLFGVDENNDFSVDEYKKSNNINDWNQVLSVKIAILAVANSENITGLEKDNRKFDVLDETLGPFNDKKIRKIYEKIITIRNRLP